jgi:hypothetical protein
MPSLSFIAPFRFSSNTVPWYSPFSATRLSHKAAFHLLWVMTHGFCRMSQSLHEIGSRKFMSLPQLYISTSHLLFSCSWLLPFFLYKVGDDFVSFLGHACNDIFNSRLSKFVLLKNNPLSCMKEVGVVSCGVVQVARIWSRFCNCRHVNPLFRHCRIFQQHSNVSIVGNMLQDMRSFWHPPGVVFVEELRIKFKIQLRIFFWYLEILSDTLVWTCNVLTWNQGHPIYTHPKENNGSEKCNEAL